MYNISRSTNEITNDSSDDYSSFVYFRKFCDFIYTSPAMSTNKFNKIPLSVAFATIKYYDTQFII